MEKKTSSNNFRLRSNNNKWQSKYLEMNSEESSVYIFNDLEIRKYLSRFFNYHGLIIHHCKIDYSCTILRIFISYYITLKAISLINKRNLNQNFCLPAKLKKKKKKKKLSVNKRVKTLRKINQIIINHKYNNKEFIEINKFSETLLESLSLFTKKKKNISITFQNLNRGLSIKLKNSQLEAFKNVILQLRRFIKNKFFRESINIMYIMISKRNSSTLLSEFIAFQLSVMKKHNFFLGYLKRTILLMTKSKFSRINGIKIVINGRFNGAPRAKNRLLHFGSVPLQTFDTKINKAQSTAYTPNGTFGVKVWICEN